MAEVECQELFRGERRVVCKNPLLAEERAHKRRELVAAAADLMEIRRALRRARPRQAQDAKAFRSEDRNGILLLEAQEAGHRRRGGLGRTLRRSDQCAEERMSAADVVLTCNRLDRVKRAFRTMKAPDL